MNKLQLLKALKDGEIYISSDNEISLYDVISTEEYEKIADELIKADYTKDDKVEGRYKKRITITNELDNISDKELTLISLMNSYKNQRQLNAINDTLNSIERMIKFFYILGVFSLVAGLLALFIYLLS